MYAYSFVISKNSNSSGSRACRSRYSFLIRWPGGPEESLSAGALLPRVEDASVAQCAREEERSFDVQCTRSICSKMGHSFVVLPPTLPVLSVGGKKQHAPVAPGPRVVAQAPAPRSGALEQCSRNDASGAHDMCPTRPPAAWSAASRGVHGQRLLVLPPVLPLVCLGGGAGRPAVRQRKLAHVVLAPSEALPTAVPREVAEAVGSSDESHLLTAKRPRELLAGAVAFRKRREPLGTQWSSVEALDAAKKEREVSDFIEALPPLLVDSLLGGDAGREQVPDADERAALLHAAVAHKAGPDGASLKNAASAWAHFLEYCSEKGVSSPLPASPVLLAAFLRWRGEKAQGAAGGLTVANSARVGLLWLRDKLDFPLEGIVSPLVAAVANPDMIRAFRRANPHVRARRVAASIPIRMYCMFEYIAASKKPSPPREFARSVVAFMMGASLRAKHALMVTVQPDEDDPKKVISGYVTLSKDGEPLRIYTPAVGFLGPLAWWPDHQKWCTKHGLCFPMWQVPWGGKGSILAVRDEAPIKPSKSAGCKAFVMPKNHLLASLKAIATMSPFGYSSAEFDALKLTGHSEHGSPSDMCEYMGTSSPFEHFSRDDVRELGHWLRLQQLDERENGAGTAAAQERRKGAAPAPKAVANAGSGAGSGECAARYVEGAGRCGRRERQLSVRYRWRMAVHEALAQHGEPWHTLPVGLADWRILHPTAEVDEDYSVSVLDATAPPDDLIIEDVD